MKTFTQNKLVLKCVYPNSSAVPLTFNEEYICSGCTIHSQKNIDWDKRLQWLLEEETL